MNTGKPAAEIVAEQTAIVLVEGEPHMRDGKGRLVTLEAVGPVRQLEDHLVRKIAMHAAALNAQIGRFKGHCGDDIGSFLALLQQEYGVVKKKNGSKGNMTFTSFDGCIRVKVSVADRITFGPELQIAKQLIDECLVEWSEGVRPEIRNLIYSTFEPDKEGQVNREALFSLRNLKFDDPRWKRAMDAIVDAIRIVGSKEYINIHVRPTPRDAWRHLTIDLASAEAPEKAEG